MFYPVTLLPFSSFVVTDGTEYNQIVALEWSDTGDKFVVTHKSGGVSVWNINGQCFLNTKFDGQCRYAIFKSDLDDVLVLATVRGDLVEWNIKNGARQNITERERFPGVRLLRFNKERELCVVTVCDSCVTACNISTGQRWSLKCDHVLRVDLNDKFLIVSSRANLSANEENSSS